MVSNIFVEHFVEVALDVAGHKPTTWPRYLKNSFMVWPHGPARLQQFLHRLNSVRPTIKFTLEAEANDTLLLLNILILKRGPKMAMKVCRKHTHTAHPHHMKRGVIHNLISQA
jgi:hypothetical protein